MTDAQLELEINHILESGANSIRLIELFKRYESPAPPAAGEKMREALTQIFNDKPVGGYNNGYHKLKNIAREALSQPPGTDEWVNDISAMLDENESVTACRLIEDYISKHASNQKK